MERLRSLQRQSSWGEEFTQAKFTGRHHLVTWQSSWEGVIYECNVCGEIEFRKAAKFIGIYTGKVHWKTSFSNLAKFMRRCNL